jgi:hypothetical protein
MILHAVIDEEQHMATDLELPPAFSSKIATFDYLVKASTPAGVQEISRELSEATPPVTI